MSNILSNISNVLPVGNLSFNSAIKGTISNTFTSAIAQIKTEFLGSNEKLIGLVNAFSWLPNFYEKTLDDGVDITNPNDMTVWITGQEASTMITMFQGLTEWFTAFGTEVMTGVYEASVTIKGQVMNLRYDTATSNLYSMSHAGFDSIRVLASGVACPVVRLWTDSSEKLVSLLDVVRSMSVSVTINSLLCDASEFCLRYVKDTAAAANFMREYLESTIDDVSTYARSFVEACGHGLVSACSWIIDAIKALNNLVAGSAGFEYSDNYALLPQDLLTGILPQLFSTISGVIGGIAAIFNAGLGLAISALGSIASQIWSKVVSVQELTKAHWASSDAVTYGDVVPFALTQSSANRGTATHVESLLQASANGVIALDGVAGTYVCWKRDVTSSGGYNSIGIEFHPSIAPHYQALLDDADAPLHGIFVPSVDSGTGEFVVSRITSSTPDLRSAITEAYSGALDYEYSVENDGSFSDADDRYAIKSVATNMLAHLFYTAASSTSTILSMFETPVRIRFSSSGQVDPSSITTVAQAIAAIYMSTRLDPSAVNQNQGNWASLVKAAAILGPSGLFAYPYTFQAVNTRQYVGSPIDVSYNPTYPVLMPKADSSSFLSAIVLITTVTAVTIAAVTVSALVVKRKIQRTKAINAAKVEAAYEAFYDNPTAANYKQYKKAVLQNNLFASVFGGTKFSKVNRWDEVEDTSFTDTLKTRFSSSASADGYSLDDVAKLIVG